MTDAHLLTVHRWICPSTQPINMLVSRLLCGSLLPLLVLCFGQEQCRNLERQRQFNESSVVKTLQCFTNYHSTVHCSWEENIPTSSEAPLALYYWDDYYGDREILCEPVGELVLSAVHGRQTTQCQYHPHKASFGINSPHCVFFKTPGLGLSASLRAQNIRMLRPVDLSEQVAVGGGRLLTWSSPYPESSSLTSTLSYQVNYRSNPQDDWTAVETNAIRWTVNATEQRPGSRHQARVRARGTIGLWSEWSPLVAWQNEGPPTVDCTLDSETVVTCSWVENRNLAQILTYQLYWRANDTARKQVCCDNPVVRASSGDPTLTHSCTFSVRDPAQLEVELLPTPHNSKTFRPHKNIRPDRPVNLTSEKKNGNLILNWKNTEDLAYDMFYEVHYWSIDNPNDSKVQQVGFHYITIPWASVRSSHRYRVQVRAVLIPGDRDTYEGLPSEWTDPVDWTLPHPDAYWSFSTFIYVFIAVVVCVVFVLLYAFIPACQRRVVMWEVSVPTPFKSKVLEEVMKKPPDSSGFSQSDRCEKTVICRLQSLETGDNVKLSSTCSSDDRLWSTLDEQFHSITRRGRSLSSSSVLLSACSTSATDTSGLSFSGPYIFCSDTSPTSSCLRSLHHPCEASANGCSDHGPPVDVSPQSMAPPIFVSHDDYVVLPQVILSTEDVSGGLNSDGVTEWPESDMNSPTLMPSPSPICPLPGDNEDPPPEYSPSLSGTFALSSLRPSFQTTGYCFLPVPEATGGWDHMQPPGLPAGVSVEAVRRHGESTVQDPYYRMLNLIP
ncbi:hypothetical protein DPEC_G00275190 [Dallia pectoralis]|uniref:Uncharacterized protein n=1 Tax=Dallia pectoralis TaxID=75939 RepID=A0ACC2FL57_DALPE|nr:hypothetical protein DPEC_G00275190 [Dallia pectoralis]